MYIDILYMYIACSMKLVLSQRDGHVYTLCMYKQSTIATMYIVNVLHIIIVCKDLF